MVGSFKIALRLLLLSCLACLCACTALRAEDIFDEAITVRGTAFDPNGKPIVGAQIYIASVQNEQKLVAETTTNEEGEYRFDDVAMPIKQPERASEAPSGVFEVFGQAKGFGFAWRGQKWYYPGRMPSFGRPDDPDNPRRFGRGQVIKQDLHFDKPAPLSGFIVDENDKPISNASVVLFNAQPLHDTKFNKSNEFLVTRNDAFTALYLSHVTPGEMRQTFSDKNGRFSFDQAPKNTGFRIFVRPPGFAQRSLFASTGTKDQIRFTDKRIYFDGMKLTFSRVKRVPVSVVYGDTGKPAPSVFVEFTGAAGSSHKVTNQDGKTELHVPAGKYKVHYLAQSGTPYISRYSRDSILNYEVPIDGEPELAIELEPAGTIEVEIVDAHIGRPIEGVDIWANNGESSDYMWRSWLPPNTSNFTIPRTDKKGKMKVFLRPGTYEIGAGKEHTPEKYSANKSGTKITIKAGEVKAIRLKMKRRGVR